MVSKWIKYLFCVTSYAEKERVEYLRDKEERGEGWGGIVSFPHSLWLWQGKCWHFRASIRLLFVIFSRGKTPGQAQSLKISCEMLQYVNVL